MTPSADTPPDLTTGETWAIWFNQALARSGMTQTEFSRLGVVSLATANRWASGGSPPGSADIVIDAAHLLAPDEVADALESAGFPRTANLVRAEHVSPEQDIWVARIRREVGLTDEERSHLEAEYLRRAAENARLLESDIAERVRRKRRDRRDRVAGEPPEGNADPTMLMAPK